MEEERRTPSIRESLETSIEILSDSPTLKALAQAIGVCLAGPFGTILAAWGIGRIDQIGKQRLKEQLTLLAEQLKTLEGQAVREDFFETDRGNDMLIKVLAEAPRTRSRLKKEFYARILRGAIVDFERMEYSPEEYLYLIADLTEKELLAARLLYEKRPQIEIEAWNEWRREARKRLNVDEADLSMLLIRIEASGLIEQVTGTTGSYVQIGSTRPGMGVYHITPAFEKLMRFLELDE